jgi:hypothetical protein
MLHFKQELYYPVKVVMCRCLTETKLFTFDYMKTPKIQVCICNFRLIL